MAYSFGLGNAPALFSALSEQQCHLYPPVPEDREELVLLSPVLHPEAVHQVQALLLQPEDELQDVLPLLLGDRQP